MTDDSDEEQLGAMLSKLTTLQLVRVFIEHLGDDLPVPCMGMDSLAIAMSLLGQRASSLYKNFQYNLGSPVEFAPVLAVRPLIELVILTKWMTLDPELHPFLYLADSDASELSHRTDVTEHAKARGQVIPEAVIDVAPLKEVTRDVAVAKLKELGINYGKGSIMPNVRRMASEVSSRIPGHKTVMDDSYIYGYKTFIGARDYVGKRSTNALNGSPLRSPVCATRTRPMSPGLISSAAASASASEPKNRVWTMDP
jgi:hypothetical protein